MCFLGLSYPRKVVHEEKSSTEGGVCGVESRGRGGANCTSMKEDLKEERRGGKVTLRRKRVKHGLPQLGGGSPPATRCHHCPGRKNQRETHLEKRGSGAWERRTQQNRGRY